MTSHWLCPMIGLLSHLFDINQTLKPSTWRPISDGFHYGLRLYLFDMSISVHIQSDRVSNRRTGFERLSFECRVWSLDIRIYEAIVECSLIERKWKQVCQLGGLRLVGYKIHFHCVWPSQQVDLHSNGKQKWRSVQVCQWPRAVCIKGLLEFQQNSSSSIRSIEALQHRVNSVATHLTLHPPRAAANSQTPQRLFSKAPFLYVEAEELKRSIMQFINW